MKTLPPSCRQATSLLSALILIFGTLTLSAQQQNHVSEWLKSYQKTSGFQEIEMFNLTAARNPLQHIVKDATTLDLDHSVLHYVLAETPTTMTFVIPNVAGDDFALELARVEITSEDFSVAVPGPNGEMNAAYNNGVHYRGIVRGKENSLASVSFFENDVMAMIADETDNYQLGKMEDGSGNFIFYASADLQASNPFNCFNDDVKVEAAPDEKVQDRYVGCKYINVYFECDYRLYLDKGSNTTNVSNYVTGLFNQVATLYANEDIDVRISQIFVWTSSDPYAGMSDISQILNNFRINRGTTFNGNIAHLLSTRNLSGGIAYVDVLCFKTYAYAVSAINNNYSNVPTYSWTIEVVTHEMGHNIGSYHTHSCNWPGGALDNCYTPEGNCASGPAPTNGGTIMSYCHLTAYGINFNNGFGPVPGDHIRNRVLNATCLSQSGSAPAGLATSNITDNAATLGWGAVAGATNYTVQYKATSSSTWLTAGTTASTSWNLTGLLAGTSYDWKVKTDCSIYSNSVSFTTTGGGGGGCSAPTALTSSNVTNNSATVSWGAVAGATQYTVEYKKSSVSTWTVAGNTSNTTFGLTNLSASTVYNWRVKANCSVYSATANFTTTTGSCSKPGSLVNNSVGSTTATVSWGNVNGAVNFTVQIRPKKGTYTDAGTVTVRTFTFTGLLPSKDYEWRVKANCSAYSNAKKFKTTASLINPDQLGSIEIKAVPNPAKSTIQMQYTGFIMPGSKVLVSDISGRVLSNLAWESTIDGIDVDGLPAGMYLLILERNGKRLASDKFVKLP